MPLHPASRCRPSCCWRFRRWPPGRHSGSAWMGPLSSAGCSIWRCMQPAVDFLLVDGGGRCKIVIAAGSRSITRSPARAIGCAAGTAPIGGSALKRVIERVVGSGDRAVLDLGIRRVNDRAIERSDGTRVAGLALAPVDLESLDPDQVAALNSAMSRPAGRPGGTDSAAGEQQQVRFRSIPGAHDCPLARGLELQERSARALGDHRRGL